MKINGKRVQLTLLPAAEVLRVRRETMQLDGADGVELSLRLDAALLALSLRNGGEQLFSDGEAVLDSLSVGQIRRFALEYEQLDEGARLDELRTSDAVQEQHTQEYNDNFDEVRFTQLKAGRTSVQYAEPGNTTAESEAAARMQYAFESEAAAHDAVRPLSVQQISTALERDARRYDGVFTML